MTATPSTDKFRVVVAAGGTGGHIFPAVAVVEQLMELTNGRCAATFLGSTDRMEARLIPSLGYPFHAMPISGFKGLRSASTLTLPLKILRSTRIAQDVIKRTKPHAVICTGAYISYPAGIAAQREGVPLIVLESNVNPGKANRRLAKNATAVVLAFEAAREYYPEAMASRLHVLGNPVRSQIDPRRSAEEARRSFGLDAKKRTVLIFGGSLGARTMNNAVVQSLPQIANEAYQVLWQIGGSYTPPSDLPSNVKVVPFIDDMGAAYAAADLVVSRSGATTVAELGIVGKPAVLVPLPSASTNEQELNARVVERAGGGVVLKDEDCAATLHATMTMLMSCDDQRIRMGAEMGTLGRLRAAHDVAELVLRIGGMTV
jgi:UDP-N-acetylglucosamine--N-acetylmuramyl-(pentapeptide) pyrophosphoryl-undecaprenol N-acetylglucosamine transferase